MISAVKFPDITIDFIRGFTSRARARKRRIKEILRAFPITDPFSFRRIINSPFIRAFIGIYDIASSLLPFLHFRKSAHFSFKPIYSLSFPFLIERHFPSTAFGTSVLKFPLIFPAVCLYAPVRVICIPIEYPLPFKLPFRIELSFIAHRIRIRIFSCYWRSAGKYSFQLISRTIPLKNSFPLIDSIGKFARIRAICEYPFQRSFALRLSVYQRSRILSFLIQHIIRHLFFHAVGRTIGTG